MLSIIIILIVIAIDQLSKIACANALKLGESVEIIKGVFSIAYVENRGAAFGMLQNAQVFFIIATVIACGAMLYFMIKEYKRMHTAMRISLALIFAARWVTLLTALRWAMFAICSISSLLIFPFSTWRTAQYA